MIPVPVVNGVCHIQVLNCYANGFKQRDLVLKVPAAIRAEDQFADLLTDEFAAENSFIDGFDQVAGFMQHRFYGIHI